MRGAAYMARLFTHTHLVVGADDRDGPNAWRNGVNSVSVSLTSDDHAVTITGTADNVAAVLMHAAARVFEVADAEQAVAS
jgi:hypothetical protein